MRDRPIALVTGASSGIGRNLAHLIASNGYDLVVVGRDEHALGELSVELDKEYDSAVELLAADLSTIAGIRRVERRIAIGDLELLVNDAGAGWYGTVAEQDPASTVGLVNLNVLALTLLSRQAASAMKAARRGAILNVSSIASFAPGPYGALYHAAKAYVTSFSEALHEELRPYGVHVTVLCPGMTPTNFHSRAGVQCATLPAWMWTAPSKVAREGLQALTRNEAVRVPGLFNRVLVAASRFAPRQLVRRSSGFVIEHLVRA